jgi:WD40 repeat protein
MKSNNEGKMSLVLYDMKHNWVERYKFDSGKEIDKINRFEISENGLQLATQLEKKSLFFIDSISQKVKEKKNAHDSSINSIKFFPKSDLLATSSDDFSLKIFYLPSLELKYNLRDLNSIDVLNIEISPTEDIIAVSFRKSYEIFLLNWEKFVEYEKPKIHEHKIENESISQIG